MQNQKGFTLIELLVVIAIIGLLSSVVLTSVSSARVKAQNAKVQMQIKEVEKAIALYYEDNNRYPTPTNTMFCDGGGNTCTVCITPGCVLPLTATLAKEKTLFEKIFVFITNAKEAIASNYILDTDTGVIDALRPYIDLTGYETPELTIPGTNVTYQGVFYQYESENIEPAVLWTQQGTNGVSFGTVSLCSTKDPDCSLQSGSTGGGTTTTPPATVNPQVITSSDPNPPVEEVPLETPVDGSTPSPEYTPSDSVTPTPTDTTSDLPTDMPTDEPITT